MKFGTGISGADKTGSAQTGTCFKAGPLAFTDVGGALLEVIEVPEISPVGGTQGWFAGLAVYRGELLSVTDFTQWAGLSGRRPHSKENSQIKQRILVVQHPDKFGDQAEKIGLLVDEVSGHVLLDQTACLRREKNELSAMLRQQLNTTDPLARSQHQPLPHLQEPLQAHLLELVKGVWSSPAEVFLVELQQLFAMEAFTSIGLRRSATAEQQSEALS